MLATRLLDSLVPRACACCGGYARRMEPLCAGCRRAMQWLGLDAALVGGVPLWAPLAYAGPVRALVAGLKYRGAVGLADTMAAFLVQGAPEGWLSGVALVPVPLHPARLRRRGFNQAELITAALVRRTGLGWSDCLRRAGRGTTQVGRGRAERAAAIEGAVGVHAGALVPPRAVLVDDVATTGATVAACAAALRGEGAGSVRAVAFARTPGR